jgi:hypothetical protein
MLIRQKQPIIIRLEKSRRYTNEDIDYQKQPTTIDLGKFRRFTNMKMMDYLKEVRSQNKPAIKRLERLKRLETLTTYLGLL